MSGINKVILVGHVGKDPEVKYLEGGVAVAKFPLATSEVYKNKEGQRVESTEWHNIVMWRGLAEVAEKYVRKGKQLYIEGKIKTRQYGEENAKKYFTEILADTMTMLGTKGDGTGNAQQSSAPSDSGRTMDPRVSEVAAGPTDDLPF
jgi:single-strand DNA-binding protein